MKDKIRVTAVSYLNTKPLLYGILNSSIQNEISLSLDIPSVCAAKLKSGEADLGLVPVAIIPQLKSPHIISDYCIGARGKVASVCIFSHCPIEEVKSLYLDYHSRTSAQLVQILLKKYWKLNPILKPNANVELQLEDKYSAALVIGDKAMGLHTQYEYVYDLAEHWYNYTQLPFVFAAWVSTKPLSDDFVKRFNKALKDGVSHIPQLVYLLPTVPHCDLTEYFTRYISYDFDTAKRAALELFLEEMGELVVSG
jgi:chorismate dehydratase